VSSSEDKRQLAEGEQDAERQPDRNREAEIFGDEIGEHPPHDRHRPALADDEIEQPQHLLEQQQHRREVRACRAAARGSADSAR
jgi:hypothetical protein